ncbi:DUF2101 family protein [Methanobacterium sp. ACI-7]|uniref:DUF2101 family protein n=1 Tax=unclassified Methanobacterium TaxID=2627676 RepID=UPI0039C22A33
MKIFAKFGDLIIKIFNFIGMLILAIPEIPNKLKNLNTDPIKDKMDRELIKENISRIKKDSTAKINEISTNQEYKYENEQINKSISGITISKKFTSKEKERAILQLQIMSGAFLVISILYIFSYLSLILYGVVGVALIVYFLYILFNKVKLMYTEDFNAYRDFFLMYIAAGIILVLISFNQDIVSAFSLSFLPSASILIFAVILVATIFLIFRIRYHRSYTFGKVIEAGKKTAYVKVDYDIRSNVKPDIYLVENDYEADDGDIVKLQVEEKLISTGGNKPVRILR